MAASHKSGPEVIKPAGSAGWVMGQNAAGNFVICAGEDLESNVAIEVDTDGNVTITNIEADITLEGALNHDGAEVGFYGTTPATQPTAYTQTYSTADKTVAAPTAAALTVSDGAGTNDGTIGAITADGSVIAAVQELADQVNKLVADVLDNKQAITALIDDLQSVGLVQ